MKQVEVTREYGGWYSPNAEFLTAASAYLFTVLFNISSHFTVIQYPHWHCLLTIAIGESQHIIMQNVAQT